jgi:transcriptional regulator with XRE-family HTH domain
MDTKNYGLKIRSAREKMGLSQYELAQKIGCTDAYVSLLENGKRIPSIEMVLSISLACGTPKVCPTCGKRI